MNSFRKNTILDAGLGFDVLASFLRFCFMSCESCSEQFIESTKIVKFLLFSSILFLDFQKIEILNPFVSNGTFLYPVKTSENRLLCSQGMEKGRIGNEWVDFQNGLISKHGFQTCKFFCIVIS